MDYNDDINGSEPRYWKVKNPTDADLVEGDLLIFVGEKPGTITKLTPKKNSTDLRNAAVRDWATGCTPLFPPTTNFDYTITGTHVSSASPIRIDFTAENRSTGVGASHQGRFDPPDPNPGLGHMSSNGSWMADEGP